MNSFDNDLERKSFIQRTLYNLENTKTKYDVTDLINSFVGLIIIPSEKMLEKITINDISKDMLKKLNKTVKEEYVNGYLRYDDIEKMIKHLRNSCAHSAMIFNDDKNNQICSITFMDKMGHKKEGFTDHWKATIPIDLLREFVFELGHIILNK